MTARKPPLKDSLTKIQQWVVLVGIPAGLATLGWLWVNFDSLRLDMTAVKTSLGFVEQDVGRHTQQLNQINQSLMKRR